MDHDLLPNWLGALAVAVVDAQAAALASDRRAADAAAILTLRQAEGLTIGNLADALGLSHSATVRVADRLCGDGWAMRRADSNTDRRQVELLLTEVGTAEGTRLQRLRTEALEGLLEPLSPGDRQVLRRSVERLLRSQSVTRRVARHTCRFCDHPRCDGPACPVGSSVT